MSIKTIRNFIAGEFVSSGATFEKRSPVNNEVIATVAEASREDVDKAVASARTALRGSWAKIPLADRSELLYAVANEMTRRFDDFVEAEEKKLGLELSVADASAVDASKLRVAVSHFVGPGGAFIPDAPYAWRGAARYDLKKDELTLTRREPTPEEPNASLPGFCLP